MRQDHEPYMRQALALAEEAAAAGEVPVGCVIVDESGQVLGRGRNRREEDHDPLAHAELLAIQDACRSHGDWRLKHARLYVTLEPCPMCAGGILSARIPEIYYGAKDAGFGACGSILNLFAYTGYTGSHTAILLSSPKISWIFPESLFAPSETKISSASMSHPLSL